ncbi:MAG: hypothetical protein M3Q13_04470 [Pseudomonadota bacterium]|nr:hypothetical protein [Pseudomonadota bacterium]
MDTRLAYRRLRHVLVLLLGLTALAMALNAWTYSYANGVPLVQADAWVFLDTYVRKYLEGNFGWKDIFLQAYSTDTNLPLHKLVLLFHINHFHMDFKVEGLIGVVAAMALVMVLVVAAAGVRLSRWRLASFALLAWLAMVTLSLNSSNVYSWPLATMWFLNLLIVALYLVYMAKSGVGPGRALAVTLLLGLLLDEVAMITVLAAVAALLIQRDPRPLRDRLLQGGGAVAGLLIVRGAYWWFYAAHGIGDQPTTGTAGFLHNLVAVVTSEGVRLALVPLGDSLIHQSVLDFWFPARAGALATVIGVVLLCAHLWFWWRVVRSREELPAEAVRTRRVAIALMLFFYGTVAGLALQRIPEFGIGYLHQPRYVIFYQLNLAALGLLAYAEFCRWIPRNDERRLAGAPFLIVLVALGVLQWHLSLRSWDETKYRSAWFEGAGRIMGQLAARPDAQLQCTPELPVCDYPVAKRRELMFLLQNYQLNIFNPDFQAFHRLRPFPPPPAAADASTASKPGE